MDGSQETVGDVLREWRQRRRLSQMSLAGDTSVSARHLSFVESGRSAGSRDMLLRLAERLAMPPRARNRLLLAGGFAPTHTERPLDAPDMLAVRQIVDSVLVAHEPFPALAVDRHWTLVAANRALAPLLAGVDNALLTPPVNVLRLSLHPSGLASRIENLSEWRHHLLERLRIQADASGDATLAKLLAELTALPTRSGRQPPSRPNGVAVPLRLRDPKSGVSLSFLSTTTVFGTATDVMLAELTMECFYPADESTRSALVAGG